ncbi:hypothetical protein [Marinilabilia salmonicolor]|uniref:HK97 family phage major capsid protein n=1 Tax=Marinilabilia salmonicolor TaxID=989 RepID=A0A368VC06_9BACT|nr:hypothetical protein [Marinilabilia salmonicolor]RCW38668.1 hypothetical protein DFO77_103138 [Marinilabilia salmonicolor]
MKLSEMISKRSEIVSEMETILSGAETAERSMNEEETAKWRELDEQQKELETQINQRKEQDAINAKQVDNQINKNNSETKMRDFKEVVTRSGDKVENFSVRAVELASGIYDEKVAGNVSSVGYEPFYKGMGVEILPNLQSAIKLPYTGVIKAAKKAAGARNDNAETLSTVLLSPSRYTVTETIGKELLAVGNEMALQSFLMEMVKGCDRAVTQDIYDQIVAGATAISGLTAYDTDAFDQITGAVDGDVSLLMPRTEFYTAKGKKIDAGSGLFLVNKASQFTGNLWDGTPVFYSGLFDGTDIAAADLKHVTVGEFGEEYEVIFDYYSKAPEGQVVVTVAKIADVKVRNANAVKKATITVV